MDDLGSPQGRYPEMFTLISLLEKCQEWGVKKEGSWWTFWDRVILNDMEDVLYPKENTLDVFNRQLPRNEGNIIIFGS